MMGRVNHDQGQLFYSFSLEEAVPDDHLVREIAAVFDLAWVRAELTPYYSSTGRPSIDPELMIRMSARSLGRNGAAFVLKLAA
jgi:transposase